MKRKPPPIDAVISGLLAEIKAGKLDAALVMADYLEERGSPYAARLREMIRKWDRAVRWFALPWVIVHRSYSPWEAIAWHHASLRIKVLRLFGKPVTTRASLTHRKLFELNEHMAPAQVLATAEGNGNAQ